MGTIIAVNGKGGTGKSTAVCLIAGYIRSKKIGSLLVVDADPNSTLEEMLGVKIDATMVGVLDETSKKRDELPAGMSKNTFIEMKVQEAIAEGEDYDVLAMGRPEGPGCYCFVNSVLRDTLNGITKSYNYLVIDNAAGMEHISRRTERAIDKFVLVSDYTVIGLRSALQIYNLAREMDIKIGKPYLIVNKVSGPLDPLRKEIDVSGLTLAGTIPYDEELMGLSLENRPISELKSERVKSSIAGIMTNILGER